MKEELLRIKEELLKIAQESLSSDEVNQIVKEKFMKALGSVIEDAFKWGAVKDALKKGADSDGYRQNT